MIISIINQKGGVAKTTTAVHLGSYLSEIGYKVLVLDFDPQMDLTKSFGVFDKTYNIVNFMKLETPIYTKINNNLSIITGYEDLEEIKIQRFALKNALDKIKNEFDFILIDCQPQKIVKNSLTSNEVVLSATDYILIPVDASSNSINGALNFINSIERIRNAYNNNLKVLGIFFSIVDSREIIFKQFFNYLKETSNDIVFDNFIRRDTKLKQATALGKTIFEYDNKSRASQDFISLGEEIIYKLKNYNND